MSLYVPPGLSPKGARSLPPFACELRTAYRLLAPEVLKGLAVQKGMTMVVIPACNEARVIRKTLENVLEVWPGNDSLGIIVSVNNTTDNTVEVIRSFARDHGQKVWLGEGAEDKPKDKDQRLKIWLLSSPPGKKNALAAQLDVYKAQSFAPERVFFLDADTAIRPGDLERLSDKLTAHDLTAVSGRLNFVDAMGEPTAKGFYRQLVHMHGKQGGVNCLPGACTLGGTAGMLAALLTTRQMVPHALSEDGIMTGIWGICQETRAAVDRETPIDTTLPRSRRDQYKRRGHWTAAGWQFVQIFGVRALNEIGIAPVLGKSLWDFLKHEKENFGFPEAARQLGWKALDVSDPRFTAATLQSLRSALRAKKKGEDTPWDTPRDAGLQT